MNGILGVFNEIYIRLMVWLGAEPPSGYEHLLEGEETPSSYTVKEGDTIFALARRVRVHHSLIAAANDIPSESFGDPLETGRVLEIPPPDWEPPAPVEDGAPEPQLPEPEPPPQLPEPEPEPQLPEPEPEPQLPEPEPEEPVSPPALVKEPDVEAEPEEETAPPVRENLPPTLSIVPDLADEEEPPEEDVAAEPEWLRDSDEPLPDDIDTIDHILAGTPPPTLEEEEEPQDTTIDDIMSSKTPIVNEPEDTDRTDEFPVATLEPPAEEPEEAEIEELIDELEEEPDAEPASGTLLDDLTVTQHDPRPELDPGKPFRYEVQRGDTMSGIARRYNVTVHELIEANAISDPSRIFPGQKLIIPGYLSVPAEPDPEPPTPSPTPRPTAIEPDEDYFVYTVSSGDTLGNIAKRHNVTIHQLVEANQLEDSGLRVGQRLYIPTTTPPRPEPPPVEAPPRELEPTPQPQIDPDFPVQGPLDATRALYVSYFALSHTDTLAYIFKLLNNTELNAVVLDVKGDHGLLSYPTGVALANDIDAATNPALKDFETLMQELKQRQIYTIARIVTFKDNPLALAYPDYAVKMRGSGARWTDNDDQAWTDPFLPEVWNYNIAVAVEAAQRGFDEVQFDYMRFPTGNQSGTPTFTKQNTRSNRIAAITSFLSAARGQLQPFGVKLAANTFGYACWRTDDTLIGQDIEQMAQYLDVLSPKLLPSTFGNGIPSYKNAIAHPYEVVHLSAERAVERVMPHGCVVRPWLQDFPDYRFDRRVYGKAEIQEQIRGSFEAGCVGFMMWDPRVKYTPTAYAPMRRAKAR